MSNITDMTIEQIDKERTFARMVLEAIENVKMPILVYDEEKEVVKKALSRYVYELESELRGN